MYKILIVDDEPLEVKSLVYIIRTKMNVIFDGIETARSGREAIEKSDTFRPDIVLMDINMPGISGIEAIEKIKDKNPFSEFIITTAFDYFDYASKAITLGVREYLLKPVRSAQLTDVLHKLINKIELRNDRIKNEAQIKEKYEEAVRSLEKIEEIYGNLICQTQINDMDDENSMVVKKADLFIKENYFREITLEDISKAVNFSPSYFSHLYKEKTGRTFIDSLINFRIAKAKELLLTEDISMKEAASAVGYWDQNYFSKLFKKMTGFSPSEYREKMRRQIV